MKTKQEKYDFDGTAEIFVSDSTLLIIIACEFTVYLISFKFKFSKFQNFYLI